MNIKEGEEIPFGYGVVCKHYEYVGWEILPMPFCWIKRLWLNLLHKYTPYLWEKRIERIQREFYLLGYKQRLRNKTLKEIEKINMEDLTWRCEICQAERPDEKIDVLTYFLQNLPGGQRNLKHCNDNQTCIEEAIKKSKTGLI